MHLGPGDRIDVWVVEAPLGRGGMGAVYRCHNLHAPRIKAAVKVLGTAVQHRPEAVNAFVREAEILYQLDHPNIVRMRNIRMDAEPPYIEMEFVEGVALRSLIKRGNLTSEQAVSIASQLASALAYLHANGVFHRDIKPANIIITPEGHLKLVDFGIAMEADDDDGVAVGTIAYLPPEADLGPEKMDAAQWDLYAGGLVLYEMLSGYKAFPVPKGLGPHEQFATVLARKQSIEFLDPGPSYPEDLRDLVGALTHRDPERRMRAATEFEAWIGRLDTNPDSLSRLARELDLPKNPPPPTPSGPPRWAFAVVPLGLLLALVFVAAVFLARQTTRQVDVAVTGVPLDHVIIGLDGARSESMSLKDVPLGAHELQWAAGPGCRVADCPGPTCLPWCAQGTVPLDVPKGDGPYPFTLQLQPAKPRPLSVQLPKPWTELPLQIRRDGKPVTELPPGRYELDVIVGGCPSESVTPGCDDSNTCPPGCSWWRGPIEIPLGDGPFAWDRAPKGKAKSKSKAKAKSKGKAKVARGGGKPVTQAQYAAWLKSHAEWGKARAQSDGRADGNYLRGWNGDAPPDPGAAVVNVPYGAARAYCGRLPTGEASPTTWSDSRTQPFHEWRVVEGRPGWRRSDGTVSNKVKRGSANAFTGFRCGR